MSLVRPTTLNESNSNIDEVGWLIHIRQTLEEKEELEEEDDAEFLVSIFHVPKPLLATHPDCYIPQQVAIGPYHYWRPELMEMERSKLAATKRLQKSLQNSLKLEHLVGQLRKFEQRIRVCYHTYLHFNGETLVWMMVIDVSFLLEFLQFHASEIQISEIAHLLDFLYEMIVPKLDEQSDIVESENREGSEKSCQNYVKQTLSEIWKMVSKLTKASMCIIKKMMFCLPWTVISNLAGFLIIKQPVEYLFFSQGKEKSEAEIQEFGLNNLVNKPPLVEEITIPSVTELSNSGICFLPTNGGILSIKFDVETGTLHLPTIGLDMNTEVLLRNLVAYEASVASGPLVFTRYTELMNGIIDSEEDAKILRENGIIMNHLKSDEEVTKLWNGMSRAIKLTRVPFLDKAIEDVNKYYNGRMSVKVWRFFKTYVLSSWEFLTLLVVIFILLLMSLQAFCSFYGCNRTTRVNTIR